MESPRTPAYAGTVPAFSAAAPDPALATATTGVRQGRPRAFRTDVLIIGAGPTGLMAGAWCARLGVRAVVTDAKPGPTRESRALALHARSLEVYRQLGLDAAVLARAVPARDISPGVGRRRLGTVHLDRLGLRLTPFPGIHVLEQSENERILSEHLASLGRPVAWRHAFRCLHERPDGTAAVTLDAPEGPVTVTARYVIAADGASSPVRRAVGTAFEGTTSPFEFYVLDALGVEGVGEGIEVRFSAEHFMLCFPMGHDERGRRSRLLGVLRAPDRADGEAGDEESSAEESGAEGDEVERRARADLAARFGISYTGTAWASRYRVHHRVAAAFRAGAVFLAGDAAHIHSPVGAQGMNTGLQDAQDLVCTLADVLAGRAGDTVLDRYEAERRPVAMNLVRTTDRVFAAVTSLSPLARVLRSVVAPTVLPVVLRLVPRSSAGGRLYGYVSQTRIHYWMGPGRTRPAGQRRGRVRGRRLPWVPDAGHAGPLPGGDGRGDNHEALNVPAWQVHAYGPAAVGTARELAERHRDKATGEPRLPVYAFRAAPDQGLPDGTAVLVRPDGFVAEVETAATGRAGSSPARQLAVRR